MNTEYYLLRKSIVPRGSVSVDKQLFLALAKYILNPGQALWIPPILALNFLGVDPEHVCNLFRSTRTEVIKLWG